MKARVLSLLWVIGYASIVSAADDQHQLLGTWQGGMPDNRGTFEIVITPDKITGRNITTGQSFGSGSYEIDSTKKTIDARGMDIPSKGRTFLGIYSLDGDMLKWCSNNGSKKRPEDLTHKPQADQYLMVLKRQR